MNKYINSHSRTLVLYVEGKFIYIPSQGEIITSDFINCEFMILQKDKPIQKIKEKNKDGRKTFNN